MAFPKHPKIQQNDKGELLLNFGEYGQEIEVACFSGDGTRCLTVQEVGIAKIRNVDSNELVAQFQPLSPLEGSEEKSPMKGGFQVFIESAALNQDGSLALLGLNDGTARLYSVETKKEILTLNEPNTEPSQDWSVIRAVAFSPDGSLALVGFFSRSVGVWNVKEKTFVRLLSGSHENRLFKKPFVRDTMTSSISATDDNKYVFAGFADMTATVWNLESGEPVFDAYNHVEKILDVWCDGENYLWATSGGAGYNFSEKQTAAKILDTGESWEEIKFSPDGRKFLARGISGTVKKWTVSTKKSQHVSEAGNGSVSITGRSNRNKLQAASRSLSLADGIRKFHSHRRRTARLGYAAESF